MLRYASGILLLFYIDMTSFRQHILRLLLVLTAALSAEPFFPMNREDFRVTERDTIYMVYLHEVYVYPPIRFRNRRQEKFYWKTVRDVKKCLPYARMIVKDMEYADLQLAQIATQKDRKRWWRQYEKYLFKKYEKDFRNMTASQGQMLMKLMDRESEQTSYELIRQYRGKASADFWQFVAKLFKNDLKEGYDGNDKDRIVERVITLVEAGQL